MLTTKEVANKLNNVRYGEEDKFTELFKQAKEDNIVIVFGYSDDGVEFRGAIDDELSAYNETTYSITKDGLILNECDQWDCPYYTKKLNDPSNIQLKIFEEKENYFWTYEIDIPHETFDVVEERSGSRTSEIEKFCRGIVFSLNDIPETNLKLKAVKELIASYKMKCNNVEDECINKLKTVWPECFK
jgi:hypothetical protein